MNTDTIAIIVAVLGVGLALWRSMDSRYKDLRQDIKETNARIDGLDSRIDAMEGRLNNRIDNLYQALFNRKDPAA